MTEGHREGKYPAKDMGQTSGRAGAPSQAGGPGVCALNLYPLPPLVAVLFQWTVAFSKMGKIYESKIDGPEPQISPFLWKRPRAKLLQLSWLWPRPGKQSKRKETSCPHPCPQPRIELLCTLSSALPAAVYWWNVVEKRNHEEKHRMPAAKDALSSQAAPAW